MSVTQLTVERFSVVSSRSFEDVLAGLERGIGRPDMATLRKRMDGALSYAEFQSVIREAVGGADLLEFLRLDLGGALRIDPAAKAYRIVRILAGNPLIMKQMIAHVPHAGSYAPVTILVFESGDGVHLCYDTMASFLASYGSRAALDVAEELDRKVMKLLTEAAG